jgi:DNA-binding winged helix-turn-helix (wHTH) protein
MIVACGPGASMSASASRRLADAWEQALVYRFEDFTLDPDTRQLLLNAGEVHLSPKAFDLLTLLVVNRVRAVSKAELQQRLWPSTFVEETNLATLVAEIRRALRDSASNPRFIRTIYGFGYRFAGELIVEVSAVRSEQPPVKPWLMFERRVIPLLEGVNVIGRAADAAIQIDSPGISRYHARILVANGNVTLEDLGSKNGSHVNGAPVTTRRLSDGDQIRLGVTVLTFRITEQGSQTETLP